MQFSNRLVPGSCIVLLLLVLAACASYPVNSPLQSVEPEFLKTSSENNTRSDELQIFLSFSGGGTRAAALAYGVLEAFAATRIEWEGRERRLLDEIDLITSVSFRFVAWSPPRLWFTATVKGKLANWLGSSTGQNNSVIPAKQAKIKTRHQMISG